MSGIFDLKQYIAVVFFIAMRHRRNIFFALVCARSCFGAPDWSGGKLVNQPLEFIPNITCLLAFVDTIYRCAML